LLIIMTRSRIAIVSLALLLVAVLLVWSRLPVILGYLLEQQLHDAGFSEVHIDIDTITSTQTRISTIRASHPSARLDASWITIKYSLAQLWRGKIESVSLGALQLTPSFNDIGEPTPVVLPVLPDQWLEAIPFHTAAFELVTVTLPETVQGIDSLAMGANMTHTPGQLEINAHLAAKDRPPLHFTLNADRNNTFVFTAHKQTDSAPFLELNSHALSMTADTVKTTLDVRADMVNLRTLAQQWFPEYALPTQFDAFSGKGDIEYTIAEQQLRSELDISLTGPEHTVQGPVSIIYQPEKLAAILGKTVNIEARNQRIADMLLPVVAVTVEDAMHCTHRLTEARWQCGPSRMQLTLPEVDSPPYRLQSQGGIISLQQLAGDEHGWQATAGVDLNAVNIVLPDNTVRIDRVLTQLQASSDMLKVTASLQAADNRLAVEIKAVHDLQKQRGTAEVELQPVSLDATYNIPGKLLQRWPYPVHIADGKIHGKANINWQEKNGQFLLDQSTTLVIAGIRGQYRQFPFSDVGGTLLIKGIDSPRLESPSGISVAEFDPGVLIKDATIQGAATLEENRQAVISLTQFSANLLGGNIRGRDTVLDFNRDDNPVTLNVEGVDISELIKLEQKQGLFGTGKLNGTLPLTLGKDGLRMEAGSLVAQAPGGVIRYTGDERVAALARSNPNVELLLKALSDFRYNLLEADIDYTPDGQLLAKLRLQGKNPELEGGRPVHLNINLEENILTLLRSLQFADEISRKIGEGIERGSKHP
jgi:hypothetical protein